jgi:hypothetical protein
MNWIKTHCYLRTHTQVFKFIGQSKGKLVFIIEEFNTEEYCFTVKEVNDMIRCGEWRQIVV